MVGSMKCKSHFLNLHALNPHNRSWRLFFLPMLLLLTLLVSTLFTFHFYLDEMDQIKLTLYGPFHSIVYQDPAAFSQDQEQHYPDEMCLFSAKVDNTSLAIGSLTDTAYDLLFQGKIDPLCDDAACVITESVAADRNVKAGESIRILGKSLRICQIIPDYGDLWLRGMEEEAADFRPAQILITPNQFAALHSEQNLPVRRMIFQRDSKALSPTDFGHRYVNYRIQRSPDQELYRSPVYFEYISYWLLILILLFLSSYYRKSSAPRLRILHRLGLTAKEGGYLLGTEIFISVCLILVLAEILSYLLTSLFLSLLFSRSLVPELSGWLLLSKKMFALPFAASLLLWLFYIPGIGTARTQQIQKRRKSFRTFHLSRPFRTQELLSFLLIIVMFNFIAVFVYSYYHATNILIASVDGEGRLLSSYDFELQEMHRLNQNQPMHAIIDGKDQDNHDQTSFYFYNPTLQNANMAMLYDKLVQDQSVQAVYPYYEDKMIYVEIPLEQASAPYFIDGFPPERILRQHPLFATHVDFTNKALVQIHLLGLPDAELKAIIASLEQTKYPNMNRESVLAGQAAILVSPSYTISEEESVGADGTKYSTKRISFADSNVPAANVQQALGSGDHTKLWNLQAAHKETYGSLTVAQAMKELTPQSHPLTVAVNVHENVAWFDATDNAFPYRLLVSNRYIQEQQISDTYSRLRIYLKGQVQNNAKELQRIRKILASAGSAQLSDQHLQMSTLHAYQQNQLTFKMLWYGLSLLLLLMTSAGIFNSHLSRNHTRYQIFFRLGLRRSAVFRRMCGQAGLAVIASCFVSALLYQITFRQFTKIWVGMPLSWELACVLWPAACSFILLCLTIYVLLKRYLLHSVIQHT